MKTITTQTIYTDDEINSAVYGKSLDVNLKDYDILDDTELANTCLDVLEMSEDIDLDALLLARALHNGVDAPTQEQLDDFDSLDDCMTMGNSVHDSHKWTVLKVYSDGSKLIANDEGNFIENETRFDDLNQEFQDYQRTAERLEFFQKEERFLKYLHMKIRNERAQYTRYYELQNKLNSIKQYSRARKMKKLGDEHFKSFKRCSEALDNYTELQGNIDAKKAEKERDEYLHRYVSIQQALPVDKLEQFEENLNSKDTIKQKRRYITKVYYWCMSKGLI